jgi:hypothetical protein
MSSPPLRISIRLSDREADSRLIHDWLLSVPQRDRGKRIRRLLAVAIRATTWYRKQHPAVEPAQSRRPRGRGGRTSSVPPARQTTVPRLTRPSPTPMPAAVPASLEPSWLDQLATQGLLTIYH